MFFTIFLLFSWYLRFLKLNNDPQKSQYNVAGEKSWKMIFSIFSFFSWFLRFLKLNNDLKKVAKNENIWVKTHFSLFSHTVTFWGRYLCSESAKTIKGIKIWCKMLIFITFHKLHHIVILGRYLASLQKGSKLWKKWKYDEKKSFFRIFTSYVRLLLFAVVI